MIHLITQYYNAEIRQFEIDYVLKKNLANPLIGRIHLFTEKDYDFGFLPEGHSSKITFPSDKARLDFRKTFEYARDNIPHEDIVIISNSDIAFDSTLSLLEGANLSGTFAYLTNYMVGGDSISPTTGMGTFQSYIEYDPDSLDMKDFSIKRNNDYGASADTWIFKNPIENLPEEKIMAGGQWACDVFISWVMSRLGYKIINPCKSIKAYHYHYIFSDTRGKNNKPGRFISNGILGNISENRSHAIFKKSKRVVVAPHLI